MKFRSKIQLLLELREIHDKESLHSFLRMICKDPLNDSKIKVSGSLEDIFESLKSVNMAILENAFEKVFGDYYEADDEEHEEIDESEEDQDDETDDFDDEDCGCEDDEDDEG